MPSASCAGITISAMHAPACPCRVLSPHGPPLCHSLQQCCALCAVLRADWCLLGPSCPSGFYPQLTAQGGLRAHQQSAQPHPLDLYAHLPDAQASFIRKPWCEDLLDIER
jgi:hypothetical protein